MAFLDLIKKPSKITLHEVKDQITRAKPVANNPRDLVAEAKRRLEHKNMSWSIDGSKKPKNKLPTKFEIEDLRNLTLDKAEKSFSVKLEKFKKVVTGNAKGKGETARNIIYGAGILPQPQNIVVSYPKNWTGESGGSSITSAMNGDFYGSVEKIGADLANKAGGISRSSIDIKKKNKRNVNDRIKVLFKDIPFRTFDMSFMLQPKEKKDIGNMNKFISDMKIASAPEITSGEGYWIFPDTFQMTYTGGNGVELFKTLELACTNITVNYTPQGIWAQFKDGSPVAIQVDLSFMELEYATRSAIMSENL